MTQELKPLDILYDQNLKIFNDKSAILLHPNTETKLCAKDAGYAGNKITDSLASDLGLHYLPMSHKKDARHL